MEHVISNTSCASQTIANSVRLRAAKGDELEAGVVPARRQIGQQLICFRIIVALYRMMKQTKIAKFWTIVLDVHGIWTKF